MPTAHLPKICIALGAPKPELLLERARAEAAAGETFLELRLDMLARAQDGLRVIESLTREHPEVKILATCRRAESGGEYRGSTGAECQVLEMALKAGAMGVDLAIESAKVQPDAARSLHAAGMLVLSYHNFDRTPALEPVYRRMAKFDAAVYKIVTTARKPSDNARVLALGKAHPRTPLVLIAMGELGAATRVLTPAYGGSFTFGAPGCGTETAPGQIGASALRRTFRADQLKKSAKLYGVIADPVGHSISPAVHNRAFQARRIDSVYLPMLVHSGQIKDFFHMADLLPVWGASVTIPHKRPILRYLEQVDPLTRRIGAVNTIWKRAGKWRGINTDVDGVRVPLERKMRLSQARVLVAGSGGAARGALFALAEAGAKIFLTGRDGDKVKALSKVSGAVPVAREEAERSHYEALVHCTPLGMYPKVDGCFFENEIPADLVFDMVYNPVETRLIAKAREAGREVIAGTEMFLEQAVRQFEIWTNEEAPRMAMSTAIVQALESYEGTRSHS